MNFYACRIDHGEQCLLLRQVQNLLIREIFINIQESYIVIIQLYWTPSPGLCLTRHTQPKSNIKNQKDDTPLCPIRRLDHEPRKNTPIVLAPSVGNHLIDKYMMQENISNWFFRKNEVPVDGYHGFEVWISMDCKN
jgi:hypothetical protein